MGFYCRLFLINPIKTFNAKWTKWNDECHTKQNVNYNKNNNNKWKQFLLLLLSRCMLKFILFVLESTRFYVVSLEIINPAKADARIQTQQKYSRDTCVFYSCCCYCCCCFILYMIIYDYRSALLVDHAIFYLFLFAFVVVKRWIWLVGWWCFWTKQGMKYQNGVLKENTREVEEEEEYRTNKYSPIIHNNKNSHTLNTNATKKKTRSFFKGKNLMKMKNKKELNKLKWMILLFLDLCCFYVFEQKKKTFFLLRLKYVFLDFFFSGWCFILWYFCTNTLTQVKL